MIFLLFFIFILFSFFQIFTYSNFPSFPHIVRQLRRIWKKGLSKIETEIGCRIDKWNSVKGDNDRRQIDLLYNTMESEIALEHHFFCQIWSSTVAHITHPHLSESILHQFSSHKIRYFHVSAQSNLIHFLILLFLSAFKKTFLSLHRWDENDFLYFPHTYV